MFNRKSNVIPERQLASDNTSGENSYIQAQGSKSSGDRYMKLAVAVKNYQRTVAVLLLLLVITVFWMGRMGSQSKYIPVFVEVDKFANVIKVDVSDKSKPIDPKRVVYAEIGRFIEDARMVVGDRLMQKKMQKRLYSHVPKVGATKQYLDDMFRDRDPFKTAETMTIDVQIVNQLPAGEKSWEIEWLEQKIDLQGKKIGDPERWKAILTSAISPPDKPEVIEQNPLGVFVTSISLARKL